MKAISNLKNKINCNIKKYIFYKNIKYIETDKGNYIIKKIKDNNIYNYLNRYHYDNYIKPVYELDEYNVYSYIDDLSFDNEEKALEIINVISKLHNETFYYKDISIEEIKDIYENKKKRLKELNDYYDYIRFIIEEKDILKPSELFLIKNISLIYICLDKANDYLDKWFTISKKKQTIRYALIHNNLELGHLIINNNSYLISWENAKYDIPIYDFTNFFKKEFNNIKFEKIFKIYLEKINITEEELYLMYIELLIPNQIIFEDSELRNIYNITYLVKYLSNAYSLILKNNEPNK